MLKIKTKEENINKCRHKQTNIKTRRKTSAAKGKKRKEKERQTAAQEQPNTMIGLDAKTNEYPTSTCIGRSPPHLGERERGR